MILTVDPCRKSSGVKKKPQISPTTRHSAASPATQGRTRAESLHEFLRVGVFPKRHGASPRPVCSKAQEPHRRAQRRLTRSAAAAAKGRSAAAPAVIPASSKSGVRHSHAPRRRAAPPRPQRSASARRAAGPAATSAARPRFSPTVSAAPKAPIIDSAGVPSEQRHHQPDIARPAQGSAAPPAPAPPASAAARSPASAPAP